MWLFIDLYLWTSDFKYLNETLQALFHLTFMYIYERVFRAHESLVIWSFIIHSHCIAVLQTWCTVIILHRIYYCTPTTMLRYTILHYTIVRYTILYCNSSWNILPYAYYYTVQKYRPDFAILNKGSLIKYLFNSP